MIDYIKLTNYQQSIRRSRTCRRCFSRSTRRFGSRLCQWTLPRHPMQSDRCTSRAVQAGFCIVYGEQVCNHEEFTRIAARRGHCVRYRGQKRVTCKMEGARIEQLKGCLCQARSVVRRYQRQRKR